MQEPLRWNLEALWEQLEPRLPGLNLEVVAEIGSTNTALLERIRAAHGADAQVPTALVAQTQTQGRGRLGRSWQARPGASLTFSLALPLPASEQGLLALVVGCALAQALDPQPEGGAPRLSLKWPNDLWLQGRKLGGILIETVATEGARMAVIGVGLNLRPEACTDPAGLSSGFACVQELHAQMQAPEALACVLPALVQGVLDYQRHGAAPWLAAFERRDALRGSLVQAGELQGRVRGINASGELLLETSTGLRALSSGEVSVRLPAHPENRS
ncbi:biotin--[acetyl-CoA-carboxylase] ligase [Roseateles sp. BYS180W]|uniref:biotin--[biotin carboxyl-carrier protein] ligase n=1 Tax=Roseateles rivi TaxID=3299028 RepID=A0ABW7FT71_9BURK